VKTPKCSSPASSWKRTIFCDCGAEEEEEEEEEEKEAADAAEAARRRRRGGAAAAKEQEEEEAAAEAARRRSRRWRSISLCLKRYYGGATVRIKDAKHSAHSWKLSLRFLLSI
jgi:hypothetical protein